MKARIKAVAIVLVVLMSICFMISCEKDKNTSNNTTPSTGDYEDTTDDTQGSNDESNDNADDSSKSYCVDFRLNDGTLIKNYTNIINGTSIIPPTAPYIPGKIFTGWSELTDNIQRDTVATAIYQDIIELKNVISTSTEYISNKSTAEMLVGIYGKVCLCGIDIKITYDITKLTFEGFYAEDAMVLTNVDEDTGTIYLNYISTDNTTGELDLCGLKFKSLLDEQTTEPFIEVTSIYYVDNQEKLSKTTYETISGKIIVIKED